MSDAERLRRLARAQRALADVAAARHVLAVRQHRESEEEADAILGALSDSPLHGIAVPTMAAALTRNGRLTEALKQEAEAATVQRRREEATADVLDERAALAERRERAAAERRRIEEIGASWPLRRR